MADKPIRFDCAGIRVPKYILGLPKGGTLIVKEQFDHAVGVINLDRCLVQTRLKDALTLAIEDKSRNQRVVCQEF
jgi:hypothetical protein